MNRFARLGAAALAATVLITGCTAGGGGDDEESTLYILTPDTEITFDPANNVTFPTTWLGLIGRRLTTWSTESGTVEVVPDLATDIGTPNEDGTEWTYTLKDGLFYENGDPITSADIKWGVERTFAPELAGGLTYHHGLLEGGSEYAGPFDGATLDAIETPDDKTIVFHLATPYGDWPWIAAMNAFVPVPEGEGTDVETFGDAMIASGPYKVESNEAGNETVLVRNEEWDPATDDARTAEPDRIVFRQSQNPATIAQSLIADTGDARTSFNASPLGGAELALVHADPAAEERLVTSDGGFLYYAALNADSELLSDQLVRQAVQYAIDRDAIVLAMGGEEAAAPATGAIPPGVPGYEGIDLYPRDVEKAQQLLAEAGHPDGVTLDLWVANEDTAPAEAMQQGLAEAGITINIVALDSGVLYGDAMGGNPDYDMFFSYWIPDYPSANSAISLLFESQYIDGGFNLSRTNSPELDAAILDAVGTTDLDEATAKWTAIDEQIMELGTMLPLYLTRSSFLRGSGIAEFEVPAYPSVQNYLTISLGE
jgi:peptide/nickel transport system substrate-binding protein